MNKMKLDNISVVICPPLLEYPEQPKDQSICTAEDCPDCKNKMWLSQKKKDANR